MKGLVHFCFFFSDIFLKFDMNGVRFFLLGKPRGLATEGFRQQLA